MSDKAEDRIPEHEGGIAVTVEEFVELKTTDEAKTFFQQLKERLLSINHWHLYCGPVSAQFMLTDSQGNEVERKPQTGDHFKIKIPAPGIKTGKGHDWVRIEEIVELAEDADDFTSIRVRPANNPASGNGDIAHFYTDEATSNFIIKREGKKVIAGVYGRNEKPNVNAAETLLDKIRNAVVGTGGAVGFSKLQWKMLVDGLLKIDDAKSE